MGGGGERIQKNVKTLRCIFFNEMFHFRNAKTFCFDIFKMKLNDIFLRNSTDFFAIIQVKGKGKMRKMQRLDGHQNETNFSPSFQQRVDMERAFPAILPTNVSLFCFNSHYTNEFPCFLHQK